MRSPALLLLVLLPLGSLRAESADVLLAAASDRELQPLIAQLESPRTETRAAWQFWLGTLRGRQVVLTRTEGDPLNAVAATTLAIRRYHPKLIVSYGTARPHDPALSAGSLVVSEKFAAFDGLFSHVRPLEDGLAPLQWERLPHLLATKGEKETPAYAFPSDPAALELAQHLPGARAGTLGSAHQANAEADRIAWLHQNWGTSCEDGESAHIAGCAQLLGVPVIGLRVMQRTNLPPGDMDTDAEQAAAAAALKLLEVLP